MAGALRASKWKEMGCPLASQAPILAAEPSTSSPWFEYVEHVFFRKLGNEEKNLEKKKHENTP